MKDICALRLWQLTGGVLQTYKKRREHLDVGLCEPTQRVQTYTSDFPNLCDLFATLGAGLCGPTCVLQAYALGFASPRNELHTSVRWTALQTYALILGTCKVPRLEAGEAAIHQPNELQAALGL